MPETEVQQKLRERFGLRLGPEMAAYVLRQLDQNPESIPVIGSDARTGVPCRVKLPTGDLKDALTSAQS